MFPKKKNLIDELLGESKCVDEILDIILNNGVGAYLLKSLSLKVIVEEEDTFLSMNRNCLWNKAQLFYKKATLDTELLRRNLILSFSGEEGVDGGALRNEFFRLAIKEMNIQYFEGDDIQRRLPKCHWGCEVEQVIAGTLVAHSLLLGGPGFPCLHPAVYDVICTSSDDTSLVNAKDIPMNSATADVIDLINQV